MDYQIKKTQTQCAQLIQNRLQIQNYDNPQRIKDRFTQNFKMRQLLQNINLASQQNKPLLLRGHTERVICLNQKVKSFQSFQKNDISLNSNTSSSKRLPPINSVSEDDRKNRKQILPPPLVLHKSKLAKKGNKGFLETIQNKIQYKFIVNELNQQNKEKISLYYNTQEASENSDQTSKVILPQINTEISSPRSIKKKNFYSCKNQLNLNQITHTPLDSDTKLIGKEVKMEAFKIEQLRNILKQNLKNNKKYNPNEDYKSYRPKTKNTILYDQVYNSFNLNQNQFDIDQFEEKYVDDFYEYVHNKSRVTMSSTKKYL